MPAADKPVPAKKARRANPQCGSGTCNHPLSFHPRDKVKHRRPCNAFGCHCKNYVKPAEETQ